MRTEVFLLGIIIIIIGLILFFGLRIPLFSNLEDLLLYFPSYYEIISMIVVLIGVIVALIGFFSFNMGKWFKYY